MKREELQELALETSEWAAYLDASQDYLVALNAAEAALDLEMKAGKAYYKTAEHKALQKATTRPQAKFRVWLMNLIKGRK